MDSHCRRKLANPRLLSWLVRRHAMVIFFIVGHLVFE
jgi:hypothetical protein